MRIYDKIFIFFLGILVCFGVSGCWAITVKADDVGKVYLKIINESGLNLTDITFSYNTKHMFSIDLQDNQEKSLKLHSLKRRLKRTGDIPYHVEEWEVKFEELDTNFYYFFNISKKCFAEKETIRPEFSLCDSKGFIKQEFFNEKELTYDGIDLYFVTITLRSEQHVSGMQVQQRICKIGDEIKD